MVTGKCFSGLDESRCSLLVLVCTMMLLNHSLNLSNIRRSNILSLLWIWLLLLLLSTKFQPKANRMQIYPRCIADQITVLILFDHSSGRKLFGWLETALIPFFFILPLSLFSFSFNGLVCVEKCSKPTTNVKNVPINFSLIFTICLL